MDLFENYWSRTSVFLVALFAGTLSACNFSTLSLNNVVSNGSNSFTFNLTMCAPSGCNTVDFLTGACIGAEMNDNTGNWGIGIDPSATITSFTGALTSPQTAALYTGSLTSAGTFVTYSNASTWWTSDATSIQPSTQACVNLQITTTGYPTDICVYGLEGADNLYTSPACPQVNGVTCVQPVPLEVEFLDFRAALQGDEVLLNWNVSFERDHDRYIIEHSPTGTHYESIASIPGAGENTNEVQSYQGRHLEPVEGINYYRISAVDLDGYYQYSNVIQVIYQPTGLKLARVFPVPSATESQIEYITEASGTYALDVFDLRGQQVMSQEMNATPGRNLFKVNMETWASGRYFARISGPGGQLNSKLIKR